VSCKILRHDGLGANPILVTVQPGLPSGGAPRPTAARDGAAPTNGQGDGRERERHPARRRDAQRARDQAPGTRVEVGGATHAGKVRVVNQDSFWVGEVAGKGTLAVVADGMGGHQTGEVASQQAVTTFRDALTRSRATPPAAMARASQAANLEIYEYALEHPEHRGMGTTLTTVLVDDQVAIVGHVGDSRAYLVRDGQIEQLTHDHSWVADRVRQGLLTDDEARRHRWRNVITNALGATTGFKLDLHHFELREGDRVLLCSDGVSMLLSEPMMQQIVSSHAPQEAAERLIEESNDRGSPDNVTAVVLRVVSVAPRPKRYALPERDDATASIDITDTLSGIRRVEDAYPTRSPFNALRKQPWYPYRLWIVGSAYLLLLFVLFSVWRAAGS
jgi:PPM family protein phosphatase